MKPAKILFVLLALSIGLAACGIKNDPEPPPATDKTQQTQ